MIKIIESIIFECIPSFEIDLVLLFGKRVHFLDSLIVIIFIFRLFFE